MKMEIDKSELMKMAWGIAKKECRRLAIVHICNNIKTVKTIRDYLNDGADELIEQYPEYIKRTVSSCMSAGLRDAWELAKENIEREIKREADAKENEIEEAAKKCNKNAPRRRLVAADKYSQGDKLGNFIVTGLGRTFRPNTDMFSLGITPDTDYVQYAYFN